MTKSTDKPDAKPAEAEPKQRPVKRPPRPSYYVPNGVAFLDKNGDLDRYEAGETIAAGVLPESLEADYLERGDIVALDD